MYKLYGTSCAAGWCTICAEPCVLQTDVQVVGRSMFCRLMYKLCGALCSAGRYVQVVRRSMFCRQICTSCAALYVLQTDVGTSCAALYVLQAGAQFVGHCVCCRLMYKLCGALCSAG